jgi:hypothetical protein
MYLQRFCTKSVLLGVLSGFSGALWAHPGHVVTDWVHLLTEPDHLLAALLTCAAAGWAIHSVRKTMQLQQKEKLDMIRSKSTLTSQEKQP